LLHKTVGSLAKTVGSLAFAASDFLKIPREPLDSIIATSVDERNLLSFFKSTELRVYIGLEINRPVDRHMDYRLLVSVSRAVTSSIVMDSRPECLNHID